MYKGARLNLTRRAREVFKYSREHLKAPTTTVKQAFYTVKYLEVVDMSRPYFESPIEIIVGAGTVL